MLHILDFALYSCIFAVVTIPADLNCTPNRSNEECLQLGRSLRCGSLWSQNPRQAHSAGRIWRRGKQSAGPHPPACPIFSLSIAVCALTFDCCFPHVRLDYKSSRIPELISCFFLAFMMRIGVHHLGVTCMENLWRTSLILHLPDHALHICLRSKLTSRVPNSTAAFLSTTMC